MEGRRKRGEEELRKRGGKKRKLNSLESHPPEKTTNIIVGYSCQLIPQIASALMHTSFSRLVLVLPVP